MKSVGEVTLHLRDGAPWKDGQFAIKWKKQDNADQVHALLV